MMRKRIDVILTEQSTTTTFSSSHHLLLFTPIHSYLSPFTSTNLSKSFSWQPNSLKQPPQFPKKEREKERDEPGGMIAWSIGEMVGRETSHPRHQPVAIAFCIGPASCGP
jgi:hypothetical protein